MTLLCKKCGSTWVLVGQATTPRPRSEWSDDDGTVLWWHLPICELPYVGSPLDDDWPGHDDDDDEWYTHWTPIMASDEVDAFLAAHPVKPSGT